MQSLCVLGRQPALGLAELESLYGATVVRKVNNTAIIDVDPCVLDFDRLGGSPKFCKVLSIIDSSKWPEVMKFLISVTPQHSRQMPAGKMHLGLSLHGFSLSPAAITASGLSLKKIIQTTGRTVRVTPSQSSTLSSAQVLHNKLTGQNGWELVLVKDGNQTICAQTIKVQDIESYTMRDRGRPKRDTRIGMLPPKLAQIIINLAAGRLPEDKLQSICEVPAEAEIPHPKFKQTVLDPFCGTGVIMQEAWLMGYDVAGTDINRQMVDYSQANVAQWLTGNFSRLGSIDIRTGDATNYSWDERAPYIVASETYLGRPFTVKPPDKLLEQTKQEVNLILKKFLTNIHAQLPPGTRLCLAVPAWQSSPNQVRHLPLVDQLEQIGYNRVRFEHSTDNQLVYCRPDQLVARELLVLIRK